MMMVVEGKHVNNAVSGRPGKILVTLEDFTSLRGEEMLQGIYFVVFGFNLSHKANPWIQPMETTKITLDIGQSDDNKDYFFGWYTDLYQVRKGKKHIFPDGLPLYYGKAGVLASIYVAALKTDIVSRSEFATKFSAIIVNLTKKIKSEQETETNTRLKNAATSLKEINNLQARFGNEKLELENTKEKKSVAPDIGRINYIIKPQNTYELDQIQTNIKENSKAVKNAFSLLIKAFEKQALLADHQIRYTNVFTFRQEEEWLEGGHKDWGDHRMALSINVDTE